MEELKDYTIRVERRNSSFVEIMVRAICLQHAEDLALNKAVRTSVEDWPIPNENFTLRREEDDDREQWLRLDCITYNDTQLLKCYEDETFEVVEDIQALEDMYKK